MAEGEHIASESALDKAASYIIRDLGAKKDKASAAKVTGPTVGAADHVHRARVPSPTYSSAA